MKNTKIKSDGFILFILMMTANVLNYLFQIVTGRMLDDTHLYGTLNTLFSMLTIISLPSTMITLVVSKYITELNIKSNYSRMCGFVLRLLKYVLLLAGIIIVMGIFISPVLGEYMHINEIKLIILTMFIGGTSIVSSIILGAMQGLKKFWTYAILGLIVPFVKLLGSIMILKLTSWGLYGIMLSLLLGNLITIFIGFFTLAKVIYKGNIENAFIGKEKIIKYSLNTFLTNSGLVILTNIDMLIIKHYFNSEAGIYSTSLVFGKMILYFASVIVVTLFPLVVENRKNGEQTGLVLKMSLIYGGGLSIFAMIALNLFGGFFISLLFGNTYAGSLRYILPISIMIVPLSMLTILVNYVLAIGKTGLMIISIVIGVIIEITIVSIWHDNINQVLLTLTSVLMLIFFINLIGAIQYGTDNKQHKGGQV